MRVRRPPRQRVLSLRVTEEARRAVEVLSERLSADRGSSVSLTDVVEEGIRLVAAREGLVLSNGGWVG